MATEAVQAGEWVLLRLADKTERLAQVNATGAVAIGKYGKVAAEHIIGLPYGHAYEVSDREKRLVYVTPEMADASFEYVAPAADNRDLVDDNTAQSLGADEIAKLKESGASGREIVEQLVQNSATFAGKTEFSQAKYLKRKHAKYLKQVVLVKPTMRTLVEHFFTKTPARIMDLRVDSLSQMLLQGNVRSGSRVLVVDDCGGLLVAGVLQRLGGSGACVALASQPDYPSFDAPKYLNLSDDMMSCLRPISWQNLGTAPTDELRIAEEKLAGAAEGDESLRTNLQRKIDRLRRVLETRAMLAEGRFDALLIGSKLDPREALSRLLPILLPSRPFAVFSGYPEMLVPANSWLRSSRVAAHVALTETWTREYQMLPGRTHPHMTTSAASGWILSGTTLEANWKDIVGARSLRPVENVEGATETTEAAETTETTEEEQPPAKRTRTEDQQEL